MQKIKRIEKLNKQQLIDIIHDLESKYEVLNNEYNTVEFVTTRLDSMDSAIRDHESRLGEIMQSRKMEKMENYNLETEIKRLHKKIKSRKLSVWQWLFSKKICKK